MKGSWVGYAYGAHARQTRRKVPLELNKFQASRARNAEKLSRRVEQVSNPRLHALKTRRKFPVELNKFQTLGF